MRVCDMCPELVLRLITAVLSSVITCFSVGQDHEHQYADRPDDFHEKLQILLDHITDLLNRQRVEEVSVRRKYSWRPVFSSVCL